MKIAAAVEARAALESDESVEAVAVLESEATLEAVGDEVAVVVCGAFAAAKQICARKVDMSVLLLAGCAASLVEVDLGVVSFPGLETFVVVELDGTLDVVVCCAFAAAIKAWAIRVGKSGVVGDDAASCVEVVSGLEASSDSVVVVVAGVEVVFAIGAFWPLEANTAARTSIVDRSDALESSVDLLFAGVLGTGAVCVVLASVVTTGASVDTAVSGSGVESSSSAVGAVVVAG